MPADADTPDGFISQSSFIVEKVTYRGRCISLIPQYPATADVDTPDGYISQPSVNVDKLTYMEMRI